MTIWNRKGYHSYPKGPCTQIVYTLAPKYLYRDYIKAKVYTIWAHGPLGLVNAAARLDMLYLSLPAVDHIFGIRVLQA